MGGGLCEAPEHPRAQEARSGGVCEQGSYHPEACTLGQEKEVMGGHWREFTETHTALQEAVNASPVGGPLTQATWAAVGHRCSPALHTCQTCWGPRMAVVTKPTGTSAKAGWGWARWRVRQQTKDGIFIGYLITTKKKKTGLQKILGQDPPRRRE